MAGFARPLTDKNAKDKERQFYRDLEYRLDDKFEPWFEKRQREYQALFDRNAKKNKKQLDNLYKFFYLENLIRNDCRDEKAIYPPLSSLKESAIVIYGPLFSNIVEADIHPQITKLANQGLAKIRKIKPD